MINLLPPEHRPRRRMLVRAASMGAMAAAAVGAVYAYVAWLWLPTARMNAEADALQQLVAKGTPALQAARELAGTQAALDRLKKVVDAADNLDAMRAALGRVAASVPTGVALTGLDLARDGTLRVAGRAADVGQVAAMVAALHEHGWTDVRIAFPQPFSNRGGQPVTFELEAREASR